MKHQHASRTAEFMALFRALESSNPGNSDSLPIPLREGFFAHHCAFLCGWRALDFPAH